MNMRFLYMGTLLISMLSVFATAQPVTIKTDKGQLLGETVYTPFGNVDMWNSIPFAKPPVGDLRFKHPVPNDAWEGVLDTTKIPNMCYQNVDEPTMKPLKNIIYANKTVSEDCLYLSVYVPHPRPNNAAVMVWIHAGSNAIGGAHNSNYNYKTLTAYSDIIIVAIQYRLTAFGFLYDGSSDIPGNAGLYDQVMALQWVQDNIKVFGGNPKQVTLTGQASGASAASTYIFSPLAFNLFNRAILQSGVPNNAIGINNKRDALFLFNNIVKSVNCSDGSTPHANVVKCLQDIKAKDLAAKVPFTSLQGIPDGKLILADRKNVLNATSTNRKTILIGSNKDEGTFGAALIIPQKIGFFENTSINSTDVMEAIKKTFSYKYNEKMQKLIYYNYMSWDDPENSIKLRANVARMFADYFYDCDLNYFVDWAADRNWNIYRYFFNYYPDKSFVPRWFGVYNNLEVDYEFGGAVYYGSEADKDLSKMFMDYISNFVKAGDPNIGSIGDSSLPKWSKYTADNRGYLNIDGKNTVFQEDYPKNKNCILWRNFIDADNQDNNCNLAKDIDPSTIEPNKVLTLTKYVMTNVMNPKSTKLEKMRRSIDWNLGFSSFTGFPKKMESKTNTTTKFEKLDNGWSVIQESKSYTDIID